MHLLLEYLYHVVVVATYSFLIMMMWNAM